MVDMARKALQIRIANKLLETKGMIKAYNQAYYEGKDKHKSLTKIEKLLDTWR